MRTSHISARVDGYLQGYMKMAASSCSGKPAKVKKHTVENKPVQVTKAKAEDVANYEKTAADKVDPRLLVGGKYPAGAVGQTLAPKRLRQNAPKVMKGPATQGQLQKFTDQVHKQRTGQALKTKVNTSLGRSSRFRRVPVKWSQVSGVPKKMQGK
jgi:hypothetical protein